jgi:hypothetical protein
LGGIGYAWVWVWAQSTTQHNLAFQKGKQKVEATMNEAVFSLVCYAIATITYHAYLYWRMIISNPESTLAGYMRKSRLSWIQRLQGREGKEILMVQTIRNGMMSSTFFGSTIVVVGSFVVSSGSCIYLCIYFFLQEQ